MNRQNTEEFQSGETVLYDCTVVDMCHYTFVQTHRLYNTKSAPYGLGVMVMCHCRFIDYSKCTTRVGVVDNGGAMNV